MTGPDTADALIRIAEALERLSPPPPPVPDVSAAGAFIWHTNPDRLEPVERVSRVDLSLLVGVNRARDTLMENTLHFAQGLPANNALLWGSRGMGKSSLVKAVHAAIREKGHDLKLVELAREDLPSVGRLLNVLRDRPARFVLFCDDLSFSHDDQHYKSLKAVLDGGIEGRALGEKELEIEWNNAEAGVSAKLVANTAERTFTITETVKGESKEIVL